MVIANASGGTATPIEPGAPGATSSASWSPDGQWILYLRALPGKGEVQVARIRPGADAGPEILKSFKTTAPELIRHPVQWSPKGEGILAHSSDALYLMSLDYKTERKIADGRFPVPLGFSKDGGQILGIVPNTALGKAAWSLVAYDVTGGSSRRLADVELPLTTSTVRGFSLHPDGSRVATAIAKWPFDLWMLEGFE